MAIKRHQPSTPGKRFRTDLRRSVTQKKPTVNSLICKGEKRSGRSRGVISVRRRGGGAKRCYRKIDFKRDKLALKAVVAAIEYDPYRTTDIALLNYQDGEKRYILAPEGLKVGDEVISGERTVLAVGNAMKLGNMPTGSKVHNIELYPGRGGQLARSAGSFATVVSKDDKHVQLKMPSGERRLVLSACRATLGQLSNMDWKNIKLGKAGRSRKMGRRPKVRGVAMYPAAHPHGGGEARAGVGMPSPRTPWGKPTLGKKTRRRKNTNKYIIKGRREK